MVDRFRKFALLRKRQSQIVFRLGQIGLQAQRLLKMFDRFRKFALLRKRQSQIVFRLGQIGVQAQCFLKLLDPPGSDL